ncbi:SurA N-terminal domain-containing protein [Candidatus Woesearchaeota archaeon]|nr:SurA N-terminal domain-containing protein [Candidatus Woesearchaeota archaeon]
MVVTWWCCYLTKKKKKTSKNSGKRKNKKQNKNQLFMFSVFAIIIVGIIYFSNMEEDSVSTIVAEINGQELLKTDLDWWYRTAVPEQHRIIISKEDFLVQSLIPQELLLQKAEEKKVIVSESEIEKLIGIFIINNGMTLEEFEENLKEKKVTIEDVQRSFKANAIVMKFVEEEGLIQGEDEQFFVDNNKFESYMETLIEESDIKIYWENINKLVLGNFKKTDEESCGLTLRLYTASFCNNCEESRNVFKEVIENFNVNGVDAAIWDIDTGDNLLTAKKETLLPEEEFKMFKKYGQDNLVPLTILGCKYRRLGNFNDSIEKELKLIINDLVRNVI